MTVATKKPPDAQGVAEGLTSPLFLEGLLEFSRHKWGLTPVRARFSEEGSVLPAVETVYYLNQRGRITAPHLSP